jgi:hypothetical protein
VSSRLEVLFGVEPDPLKFLIFEKLLTTAAGRTAIAQERKFHYDACSAQHKSASFIMMTCSAQHKSASFSTMTCSADIGLYIEYIYIYLYLDLRNNGELLSILRPSGM